MSTGQKNPHHPERPGADTLGGNVGRQVFPHQSMRLIPLYKGKIHAPSSIILDKPSNAKNCFTKPLHASTTSKGEERCSFGNFPGEHHRVKNSLPPSPPKTAPTQHTQKKHPTQHNYKTKITLNRNTKFSPIPNTQISRRAYLAQLLTDAQQRLQND